MFAQDSEERGVELMEGIAIKTLAYGEKTLTATFRLKAGSVLPLHRHPHEQTGYLLSGRMKFTVDGSEQIVGPGGCWTIKGGIEHGAQVMEDAHVIEVFSPVRSDYLPEVLARRG